MTKRRKILLGALAAAAALALLFLFWDHDAPYTARVVDAESGKPVEGAIYLAVWWKNSAFKEKPWWEGPATVMERFVEGRTGPDGIINVPGFWRRRIAFNPNTLTVYKPGYVLWFQEKIFPTYANRTDFGREHRVVKLQRWMDTMLYGAHSRFLITATKGNLSHEVYESGEHVLQQTFDKHESLLYQQERTR